MHWRRLLVGGVVIAVLAWASGYLERGPETPGTAGGLLPAGQAEPGVADSTQGEFRTVRLYFASTGGDKLVSETREVSSAAGLHGQVEDRKSTRLNSSHGSISYDVFCLTKKKRSVHPLFLSDAETGHGDLTVHEDYG